MIYSSYDTSDYWSDLDNDTLFSGLEISLPTFPLKVLTWGHRNSINWIDLNTYLENFNGTLKECLSLYGGSLLILLHNSFHVRFTVKGMRDINEIFQKRKNRHATNQRPTKVSIW